MLFKRKLPLISNTPPTTPRTSATLMLLSDTPGVCSTSKISRALFATSTYVAAGPRKAANRVSALARSPTSAMTLAAPVATSTQSDRRSSSPFWSFFNNSPVAFTNATESVCALPMVIVNVAELPAILITSLEKIEKFEFENWIHKK